MQIELPPEIEQIALNAVAAGRYETVADFIAAAVKDVQDSEVECLPASSVGPEELSDVEWNQLFDQFLKSRRPTNPNFDDSRESMYPVR